MWGFALCCRGLGQPPSLHHANLSVCLRGLGGQPCCVSLQWCNVSDGKTVAQQCMKEPPLQRAREPWLAAAFNNSHFHNGGIHFLPDLNCWEHSNICSPGRVSSWETRPFFVVFVLVKNFSGSLTSPIAIHKSCYIAFCIFSARLRTEGIFEGLCNQVALQQAGATLCTHTTPVHPLLPIGRQSTMSSLLLVNVLQAARAWEWHASFTCSPHLNTSGSWRLSCLRSSWCEQAAFIH